MSSKSSSKERSGILLDAGTNEVELLVFRSGKILFAVNVAKVREIIRRVKTVSLPLSGAAIEGMIPIRDETMPLLNLCTCLGIPAEESAEGEGLIIVLELNKTRCGVLVDAVEMIHRLGWDEIESPPSGLRVNEVPITGVVKREGQIVQVIDFERIIGETLGLSDDMGALGRRIAAGREMMPILVADDSSTIRKRLASLLEETGFRNLTICNDGQDAWERIEAAADEQGGAPFELVLTDIEMPRMDGLNLTRRIKEDPRTRSTIVVLFSSLISEDNIRKGNQVGADAQVTKLDSGPLLEAIYKCLEPDAPAACAPASSSEPLPAGV